jgi:hypothetical protein
MKGKLNKNERGWFVNYIHYDFPPLEYKEKKLSLPLHPKDVKTCNDYGDYSVDWDGKEVEFEIIKEYIDSHTNQVQTYAKLN